MTLYEIASQYKDALDNIQIDEDGCVIGAEELEALGGQLDDKLEACALAVKNLEADAFALGVEAQSLIARKNQKQKKADYLRDYIKSMMIIAQRGDFESPKVRLSFRKSESVTADVDRLPEAYIRTKTTFEADKTALKKALKAGEVIEGAMLVEDKKLQIK